MLKSAIQNSQIYKDYNNEQNKLTKKINSLVYNKLGSASYEDSPVN
jgi:hypothetical protein